MMQMLLPSQIQAQEKSRETPLGSAVDALARGAWEDARECFEHVIKADETPEALESLGLAHWWLNDSARACRARERAYRLYRKRGDDRGAARMAIWLAWDYHSFRGELAVANGWLQWAHRLLEGLDPTPEHGWLKVREGEIALLDQYDIPAARRLGAEAAEIGRSLGVLDLEMLGVSLEGLALVVEGEVARGMAQLDEATTAAVAGELRDPAAIGEACCLLIFACEIVRDYARAAQWCARLRELAQRSAKRSLLAICHAHYASVLTSCGDWSEAETELEAATRELAEFYPVMLPEAWVRLGELRRRQGRLAEAEELFRRAEFHPQAQLGAAALALDRDDPETAVDQAERLLRHLSESDVATRAAALELLAQALARSGGTGRLPAVLSALDAAAATLDTELIRAATTRSHAAAAAAAGKVEEARRLYEDAIQLFSGSGAPFETAQARLDLATVLTALERPADAAEEARVAQDAFLALGASYMTEHAASLLKQLEAGDGDRQAEGPSPPCSDGGLTRRELEVLRLIAEGLTNRGIAERLFLSEHTIHRHVANILRKLDLSSRAAAAAQAARKGLL